MPERDSVSDRPDVIRVRTMDSSGNAYAVLVRTGVLDSIPSILGASASAMRTAVITDDTVAGLYGRRLAGSFAEAGAPVEVLTVPAGEGSKTRDSWARLTDELLDLGFGRDSRVIGLGGGVVGDLAGFVAATYMRGIEFVNIPTTLLAMVDASIGGKTGVDTRAGKNLVGAFHQPGMVAIDPAVLASLSTGHYRAGLAEAIKHGIVADADYAEWIVENADAIAGVNMATVTPLIKRSVRIKADIVAEDTLEAGVRAILNFGHTIGHAIEHASGWTVPHGFAVAAGMAVEARLGERLGATSAGTAEFIEAALERLGLPIGIGGFDIDPAAVIAATSADKKARAAAVRYVFPESVGRVARTADGAWTWPVREEDALAALAPPATP